VLLFVMGIIFIGVVWGGLRIVLFGVVRGVVLMGCR